MSSKRSKPRRTKSYRPQHIQIPVMPELQDAFMFSGHGALATMRLSPNREAFDQLAAIFNVIAVALHDSGRHSAILDSGIRTMQEVADRFDRSNILAIGHYQLPPIQNAMLECERLVKTLDIFGLHKARIKTLAMQRLTGADVSLEAA